MTRFLDDTMTEAGSGTTVLSSHTGETGATWTGHPAGAQNGGTKYIGIDQATDEAFDAAGFSGENHIYYASGTPANADQDVRAHLIRRGAYNTGQGIRLYARMGTTSNFDAYVLIIANDNASGVRCTLYRWRATPSATVIGATSAAIAMTQDAEVIFRLRVVGPVIDTFYSTDGGSNWTSIHSAVSDTQVTQVGKVGIAYTDVASTSRTAQIVMTRITADDAVTQTTKTFTLDGIVTATGTTTFTLDAIVTDPTKTKTFTVDAIVDAPAWYPVSVATVGTQTFTLDGIVVSGVATTYTKTFTLDGLVTALGVTKTFTLDGIIAASVTPGAGPYTRPFSAPLAVSSVTAPLALQNVTAPLSMETT